MAKAKSKPQQDTEGSAVLKLKNVRLSFPSLFKNETYKGEDTGKKSGTFLVEAGSKQHERIEKFIEDAIQTALDNDKFDGKPKRKNIVVTLKDGDEEDYAGYEGMMSLKGSSSRNVLLINRDRSPLLPEDEEEFLYPGVRVNANVDFSAGTDGYGNHRVWCNLRGVQFYQHDERFAGAAPADPDEFEDFDDDDDDDDPLA